MYRNCPEHPIIADFLQKGEPKENSVAKKWIIFEEMDERELQFENAATVTAEEYGRMCIRGAGADLFGGE